MIESVVMRKCNVGYKQSKQIVAMARDFLRLSADSNLLWSKELENACVLVYNSTNCEESVDVKTLKSVPVSTSKRSLQKTKSSSNIKKDDLEKPVTKERKARSLSKSRTRKTSKSPMVDSESTDPQSRSCRSREPLASSCSSHRRSTSRIRKLEKVSDSDDLMKSVKCVERLGESKDVRSNRPQRSRSEKSSNSKTSDRSQSSKSPSSTSSRKSKSRSSGDMDKSFTDLNQEEFSKATTDSERLAEVSSKKQIGTKKSPQSTSIPEVSRRPRSSSESSSDREKHSRTISRKSSSTPTDSERPDMERRFRTSSESRRPQRSPEAANSSEKVVKRYLFPESPSSRSTQNENGNYRKTLNRNDSTAIDKSGHHQSMARGPEFKSCSLDLKSKNSTTEAKTKAIRLDDNKECWDRSLSVSSMKKLSKRIHNESKFLDNDDESSCGSFACSSKPSIARRIQTEDNRQNNVSTLALRRPRSPGPRIGANSDCDTSKKMPPLTVHDKSNPSIRLENSIRHFADDRISSTERRVNRTSVSPSPGMSACKNDRIDPVSPKSSARPLSTKSSSVASSALTIKKSAVSRRRLSMEELEKACEADPGLRDAIVANFGRDSSGIRLGTYRTAPKTAAGLGDEFTKSFEEWEEHNDDSSESTNATTKSPALQQYTLDNPLSKFIGKLSNKSSSNKDENTVSTGSESSTKSKTRMVPVMKNTTSPAKKSFPKGDTSEASSGKPSRIVKNTSIMTLMSTDFEDPFIAKKKDAPKSRNLHIGGNSGKVSPNVSKTAGCSIEESVLSRTSNTTETTYSSSKDDSEEDIPIVDYAVPSFLDEYSEDQIFPEFSERFAKNNGLKRKESVRVSSRKDVSASFTEGTSPSSTKKSSLKSALEPPKLPQRKLSMVGSLR